VFIASSYSIVSTDTQRVVAEADLPLPTFDFELVDDGAGDPDRVHPEPELAWPSEKIAVLSDLQLADRPAFERAGWMVFIHPEGGFELAGDLVAGGDEVLG
jgi:hypothetical protein